jgi:ATP/maltotriose-dependent transcriptional regulator MalT
MNTVKSHTRMLYLRLGVTTRTAAVGAARERGLLPWSPGATS